MSAAAATADPRSDMTVLRLAAAGIVAVAALALGTASVVAFFAGGYLLQAALYAVTAVALARLAGRLRRRRRRAFGYLPLPSIAPHR